MAAEAAIHDDSPYSKPLADVDGRLRGHDVGG